MDGKAYDEPTEQSDWLIDANGNRCSISYFGSREKAQEALDSLVNCFNCRDCKDCTGCWNCRYCTNCRDCMDCHGGLDCSNCKECFNFRNCTSCWGCRNCFGCSGCMGCEDCGNCNDCKGCKNCLDCKFCGYCTNCTNCTNCEACMDSRDCESCWDCKTLTNCSYYFNACSIDPSEIPIIEDIHRKLYEAISSEGCKLGVHSWHTCDTTHCWAGWIVHLAGEKGYELEKKTNTPFAAHLIYKASGYEIPMDRFYDNNETVMQDIKRLARVE